MAQTSGTTHIKGEKFFWEKVKIEDAYLGYDSDHRTLEIVIKIKGDGSCVHGLFAKGDISEPKISHEATRRLWTFFRLIKIGKLENLVGKEVLLFQKVINGSVVNVGISPLDYDKPVIGSWAYF